MQLCFRDRSRRRREAAARRLGQGQVVLASLQECGDERSVDKAEQRHHLSALAVASLFAVVASSLASGWVASQRVRAATSGSIPLFRHHDASSPYAAGEIGVRLLKKKSRENAV